jgi:hypothetical protein
VAEAFPATIGFERDFGTFKLDVATGKAAPIEISAAEL